MLGLITKHEQFGNRAFVKERSSKQEDIQKSLCLRRARAAVFVPSAYVVNSDSKTQKGEHWVAIYFDKNKRGEYFDNYGLLSAILGLEAYMDRFSLDWICKRKPIQSLFLTVCGHYCVCFILFRCRVIPLHAVVSVFTSNLTKNDCRVSEFIRNLSQRQLYPPILFFNKHDQHITSVIQVCKV